jgi:sugar O-acyltransferase (sialic acid O-acetyltransferase NeuD family)
MQYEVIGTDNNLASIAKNTPYAFIAIGHSKGLEYRRNLFLQIAAIGFKIPSVVSPISYVSKHSNIGDGTIVMHGAKVNASATVGDNCIINTHSLIEHGTLIGNNCHISTGAIINGDVRIGASTLIGSGAVIKEGVRIGSNVRIGMGITVRKNLDDNVTYFGEAK